MLKLGTVIIPVMPVDEVIETVVAAEQIGLEYCLVADESLMLDAHVALAAAARETSEIHLGPVTNGYTRHPAVTATAVASLDDLSRGRAVVTIVAGGSMALAPLGIARDAPVSVVGETVEVMKRLWSGEQVTWAGERFRLDNAMSGMGPKDIPVWIAARGPRLLHLAGRSADGVVLEVKADLPEALALVGGGATDRIRRPERIYLDRLAYRPDLRVGATSSVFVHVLMDSPARQLRALGLDDGQIEAFRSSYETDGPEQARSHIPDEAVLQHQIVGSPEQCSAVLRDLVTGLELDVFLFYLNHRGLAANIEMMEDVRAIVDAANSP